MFEVGKTRIERLVGPAKFHFIDGCALTAEDIEAGLNDLQATLEYAEPAERKEMLREHIRVVNVPKTGPALLETNPEGLLSSLDGLRVIGDPEGSRTPVAGMKTRCPDR